MRGSTTNFVHWQMNGYTTYSISYNEILSNNKEQIANTCNNMMNLRSIMVSAKLNTKGHILCDCIYMNF